MKDSRIWHYNVQLDAKGAAYLQLLCKLEHYLKPAEGVSAQLKNSTVETDVYLEECTEATFRIDELEAKMKELGDQLEQLSHVLGELKAVQGELLSVEKNLLLPQKQSSRP